ncbi:MAG: N(4)-(beta-N-acetylglucosaminyl)-L-asparaginase [Phycisphaerales bacterium]|nr:N(4)-(beta-N-acetylglucosaminyl)-L-asparaginase [Phycisphaerales bacterium]MCB9857269.1 N(4)-(beta-N-acetylglucosaminyl)-L-asparaginase [Phycisphaerales bacterium]MCB9863017.1 N(4)-(beta-N-acetylglucosaminyl)-L-asparaginase [Phycisphaerales bacterium]
MAAESNVNRRTFIQVSTAAVAGGLVSQDVLAGPAAASERASAGRRPVVISSANGLAAVAEAMRQLNSGADPLDAVIEGVVKVEDDPNDTSVGLGGLPNEDGVVELDASCMHGPTHKAGGVAALRNIRNPSKVARLVMQRTDHVLIVGEGALRFAKAHGFMEENLLTDASREIWLRWKESLSKDDDWLEPGEWNGGGKGAANPAAIPFTYGTINCCAVDAKGDIAGVTTTSGLSYKIPGRVGDSPIIGAGLYVDNKVGAAGSTGRGEANLQNCSSFQIVDEMRRGNSPEEACRIVLERIVEHTESRLRKKNGRPDYDLKFYAVSKTGEYAAASLWSGAKFAVHDGAQAKLEDMHYLYKAE